MRQEIVVVAVVAVVVIVVVLVVVVVVVIVVVIIYLDRSAFLRARHQVSTKRKVSRTSRQKADGNSGNGCAAAVHQESINLEQCQGLLFRRVRRLWRRCQVPTHLIVGISMRLDRGSAELYRRKVHPGNHRQTFEKCSIGRSTMRQEVDGSSARGCVAVMHRLWRRCQGLRRRLAVSIPLPGGCQSKR